MRELRDRLGEALHLMAFHDDPMPWCADDPQAKFGRVLSEACKEEWRRQADRFLAVVGPKCGVAVE